MSVLASNVIAFPRPARSARITLAATMATLAAVRGQPAPPRPEPALPTREMIEARAVLAAYGRDG